MKLSRRTFVNGSLASGAALALAGMGTQAVLAEEAVAQTLVPPTFEFDFHTPVEGEPAFVAEPIDDSQIAQTLSCDVVVCGAGLAGASAALSAVDNGLSVIVLEKSGVASGRGAQLGAIGSKVQVDAGTDEIDPVEFVDDAMQSMCFKASRKVWEVYAQRCGEAADWLIDRLGGACGDWRADNPKTLVNSHVKSWASTIMPAGGMASVAPAALDAAIAAGAQAFFNTPAVQLVTAADGSVTGVIARDADGAYCKVEAAKGVVLATGGYEDNWEMLCRCIEPRDLAVAGWRNPSLANTGDGHLMGEAVGAAMDDYPHAIMNDPGAAMGSHQFCRPLAQPFLRVNEFGERFVNEAASQEYVAGAIAVQPGCHDFVILAGDVEANISELFEKRGLPWPAAEMAEMFMPELVSADTLEELAEVCGIDPEGLARTVEMYNGFYDAQEDTQFHKDASCLLAVAEPPYHACEEGQAALVTVSGLKVSERSEVLTPTAAVIPGLYALGNVSGSMFDAYYPHHLQANSHGRCVTFGYLLGRHLAGLEA